MQAAIETYKQASANSIGAQDMSIDASYTLDLSALGQSISCGGDLDLAYKLPDDLDDVLDTEALMEFSFDMSGGELYGLDFDTIMNLYLTDQTIYFETTVSGETEKTALRLSSLDDAAYQELLDSFEELASGNATDTTDITPYVTNGSFQGGRIVLDIDMIGYIGAEMENLSEELGYSSSDISSMMDLLESYINDIDTQFVATLDNNLRFATAGLTMNVTLDSSSFGSSSSYMGDVTINFVFDCKDISYDTGRNIDFPDLNGFDMNGLDFDEMFDLVA